MNDADRKLCMEKPKLERCSDSGHEAHLVEDGLGYFVECSYDACFNTTEFITSSIAA